MIYKQYLKLHHSRSVNVKVSKVITVSRREGKINSKSDRDRYLKEILLVNFNTITR